MATLREKNKIIDLMTCPSPISCSIFSLAGIGRSTWDGNVMKVLLLAGVITA